MSIEDREAIEDRDADRWQDMAVEGAAVCIKRR